MRISKSTGGILLLILLTFIGIKLSGVFLDKKAEQSIQETYDRDQNGVINGLQSISVLQGKDQALLLVHGFLDSPAIFSELIADIKHKINSDIYAPLLPFHGRDLAAATHFNNQIILDTLNQQIQALAKQYPSLTILGMSYGGVLLTTLIEQHQIPANVHIILYAPAFFLKTNTFWVRSEAQLYQLWRQYCNYPALGCTFPNYASGDALAKPMFDAEKSLRYTVIPALLQLYQLALDEEKSFTHLHRPFDLIIAVDDNRISYDRQKTACDGNQPYCHLYTFPSGKHMIHWGENKPAFEALLIKLVNKKTSNKNIKP